MGGITRNSGWVSGAQVLGKSNNTNVIVISHIINNIGHPNTIYSRIKYGPADTGASGTYSRPENPHENSLKLGHIIFCFISMRQQDIIEHSVHTEIDTVDS